jgi:hypothetical protein
MFKVKDKTGQEIYLKDKVKYTKPADLIAGDDEEVTVYGWVISMPSMEVIEVQPEEEGKPILIDAVDVIVTESLTQAVLDLHNNEELQQLLLLAEERHNKAVAESKPKRGGGGGGKRGPKQPEPDNPFA